MKNESFDRPHLYRNPEHARSSEDVRDARARKDKLDWELEDDVVIEKASMILDRVGLTLEDLTDKKVLDVGSGPRFVERAAHIKKIATRIVSLDINKSTLGENTPDLPGGVRASIRKGPPIKDGSIDLLISVSGPYSVNYNEKHTKTKDAALRQYEDAVAMLSEDGEARITEPRLGYVREQIVTPEVDALLKKRYEEGHDSMQPEERNRLTQFENEEVPDASVAFLRENGFNVEQIFRDNPRLKYRTSFITLRKNSSTPNR